MTRFLDADIGIDELNPAYLLYLFCDLGQYLHIRVKRRADSHIEIKRQFILIVCRDPISANA